MLAGARSPYLRMHACDPVEWVTWEYVEGRLGRLGKPLFVSIGYSSCHWCHVMHRESFMDPEVAGWINRVFVPVKVDREERPDVDEYYMAYCMAARGSCGWPLTVAADEWGRPFFVATYMRPSQIVELARAVEEELARGGGGLRGIAEEAARALEALYKPKEARLGGREALYRLEDAAWEVYDEAFGGFGVAPKFPQAPLLNALLAAHARLGGGRPLRMVVETLHWMAVGGVHDWVGGGFHRYAVDRDWRTPHFEKMLYDQACLARVYGEALKATGDQVFRAVGEGIVRFLRDEMLVDGGLAAALDSESGGVEGGYYTWTLEELGEALGELAPLASTVFDLAPEGNYVDEATGRPTGRNVLHIGVPLPRLAEGMGVSLGELLRLIGEIAARLRGARRGREPPARDWKVLASWNGLALWGLSSLAQAGVGGALELAVEVARRLESSVLDGCRVMRAYAGGEAYLEGMLPDYAHLSLGLLALHSATGGDRYLELSHCIAREIPGLFQDPGGLLRLRRGGPVELHDGAHPSGYSAAVEVMERLGRLLDDRGLRDAARRAARAAAGWLADAPLRYPHLAVALDLLDGPSFDVVVAEGEGLADALRTLGSVPAHYYTLAVSRRGGYLERAAGYASSLAALEGRATVHVCEEGACALPTTDASRAARYILTRGRAGGRG